jgi:hypothetical protein
MQRAPAPEHSGVSTIAGWRQAGAGPHEWQGVKVIIHSDGAVFSLPRR